MIVTHTINSKGERRIYLGASSQLECYILPLADGTAWTLKYQASPMSRAIPQDRLHAWVRERLMALCDMLGVSLESLSSVPYDDIAALHTPPPIHDRRVGAIAHPLATTFVAHIPGTPPPENPKPPKMSARKPQR